MEQEREEPLFGGIEPGRVVRVGNTVRRPAGPWTPTIHALLRHLQAKGFPAPAPLGMDRMGREMLSWLPGAASNWPWPPALLATSGARRIGALLRRYHDAVADFSAPAPAVWRHGAQTPAPGELILHGDFGPHNLIWREGALTGVIDFELARPGQPIEDAVFAAIRAASLRPDDMARSAGFAGAPDRKARLAAFAQGYGCSAGELLARACAVQSDELKRIIGFGGAGIEPWASFLRLRLDAQVRLELAWLETHAPSLG